MKPERITALALLMLAAGAHADTSVGADTYNSQTLRRGTTSVATVNPATPDACHARAQIDAETRRASAAYTCGSISFQVTYTAPPPAPTPPTVALSASPGTVSPGETSTLSWSSTNATSCTAGGSWNGTKATSGSEATTALTATSSFSLACSGPAGTANASTTVTVATAGSITGLNFPSNSSDWVDHSFRFTGANLLPMQPATYIWNVNLRQQSGYYTTFFHGFGNGSFTGSNQYYGAHPYPNNPPNGNTHKWEISANGQDVTADVNGNSTTVQYGRWYTQALTATNSGGNTVLTFYYDLPDTGRRITYTVQGGVSPSSSQALVFGAAPWAYFQERLSGILRGIRIYSGSLSQADILSEADSPLSTSAGSASVWYMNMNPTPSDISDKSGRGHHPAWSGSGRPTLWSAP